MNERLGESPPLSSFFEQAFYGEPYAGAGPVEHESREEGAQLYDASIDTLLVRVDAGKQYVGVVQERGGELSAKQVQAVRDANASALRPRDPFAMQRGDEAYRASLRVTHRFRVACRLYVPPARDGVALSKLPLIVRMHGVPTNKEQMHAVDRRVARYLPVLSIDMLGMGESDKPRFIGANTRTHRRALERYLRTGASPAASASESRVWQWANDSEYIDELVRAVVRHSPALRSDAVRKFIFVADDWGGGQALTFAERFDRQRLLGLALIDPIAFDGYPVSEIEAIGRTAAIASDAQFMSAMGAADQTMVQIYKTMVYRPRVYNQYKYREVLHQYAVATYNGVAQPDGTRVPFTPLAAPLDMHALRVLADRASVLSPALLQPKTRANPRGVDYTRISVPVAVLWGYNDNMMPAHQRFRFMYALVNAPVRTSVIDRAGHFAATDRPDVVAEELLVWIQEYHGRDILQRAFLGFRRDEIRKGDDKQLARAIDAAIQSGALRYAAPERERAKSERRELPSVGALDGELQSAVFEIS